jgi:8-oxo-dGTP pyrophosphatase MutT (NUDIX family)
VGAGPVIDNSAGTRWKPNVTVAAIVERDGRYLLVEEASPRGPLLNNPAGHLDPGETLLQAVVREVLEETACVFTPTHLLGIHLAPSATDDEVTYLRFAFTGSVGAPEPGRALDHGILRTLWLTPEEIAAERARHRSALLMRCIEDHCAGRRYPLDLLRADESFYAAITRR